MRRRSMGAWLAVALLAIVGGCGWNDHADDEAAEVRALDAPAGDLAEIIGAQEGASITREDRVPCSSDGPANVWFTVALTDPDVEEFRAGVERAALDTEWRESPERSTLARDFDRITFLLSIEAPAEPSSGPVEVVVGARMLDMTTCR